MKATDYITQFLYAQGVRQVYELVGGMITHLIDSIHRDGRIRIVSVHHEQAAAFAAEADARVTGIPGVALATSGPGATNLLTGIGSCYFDSTPAVFITGQVNRNELKTNRPIRQLGFQETDIVSMAAPITKGVWQVKTPDELPALLAKAFYIAQAGRPGPVLLDIPMDVQRMEVTDPVPSQAVIVNEVPGAPTEDDIAALIKDIRQAKRPLILAGGGIRSARSTTLFRSLVNRLQIPVVNSLMATDALPYEHPLRVGMIGSYGNRWANLAIGAADLLLVIGSRLDIRQTGSETSAFKGNRIIYHVDCESGEINNRVKDCNPITAHLRPFLRTLNEALEHELVSTYSDWLNEINTIRKQWPDTNELINITGINPNILMHSLSKASKDASMFVVDVGQHQMWAAQSLELQQQQQFLTSGGMGAMGFSLPAAIGGACALPDKAVVLIAGDGSFQLNIQELETIVRNRLPIKMVILNNHCHGMVRQFQQSYFEQRYQSTVQGYSAPDFTRIAAAYGISSRTVKDSDDLDAALTDLWADARSPFLLNILIDTFTNVYPKIAFGHPMTEMEPFVQPIEMEST